MTLKSKIITTEIDQDGDYLGVYALLLEAKCELEEV